MEKSVRDAKRAKRGKRLNAFTEDSEVAHKKRKVKKSIGFASELTDTSKKALSKYRNGDRGKPLQPGKGKTASRLAPAEKKKRLSELRKTKSAKSFKSTKKFKRR